MAGTYTLGNANLNNGTSTWVDFTSGGVAIDAPDTQWDERERLFGINRQTRVRTSKLRQITIPMMVYGATADALRTALDLIRVECQKTTNTLTLKRDGETSGLTYTCVRQTQPSVPWDLLYDMAHRARFDLILTCEPFAYGGEITLYNASAQTSPCVLSLASMVGDYAAPIEVTLTGTVENIANARLGLVPDLSYSAYVEAETPSWTGGTTSTVADAAAHGGNVKRNTSSTAAVATYADTAAYQAGTYLPLARCKTSANSMDVGYGYGGTEYASENVTSTFFKIVALAPVALPIVKTRSGTAANLQVRFDQNTSGNGDLDWFGLCPLSWGYAEWVNTAAGDAATVIFGYDGTCYAAGVASPGYKAGGPVYGDRTMALAIFADDANGSDDALPLAVTIKYVPRYAQ